jgi:hypothetical protein
MISSNKVKPLLTVTTNVRPLRIDAGFITKLPSFVAIDRISGTHSRISGKKWLQASFLLGFVTVTQVTKYPLKRSSEDCQVAFWQTPLAAWQVVPIYS